MIQKILYPILGRGIFIDSMFFYVNIIRYFKGGITLDLEYIQFIEDWHNELIDLQESCCGISLFPLQEAESKPGLISRFIGFIRKKIKAAKKFINTMFDRAITFIRKALHIKPKKPEVFVGVVKQGPISPRENTADSIVR